MTTGLGTPDGLLLARRYPASPIHELHGVDDPIFIIHGNLAGSVSKDQTLLVQSTLSHDASVSMSGTGVRFQFNDPSSMAWTASLAEKVLQADFSADLVKLLDGASQATPGTMQVVAGQSVGVSIDNSQAGLYPGGLTNDYGFVKWGSSRGTVTVARPVVVAETPLGVDDVNGIVRIRQNGAYDQHLTLYRVDDLTGHIGNLAPGDAGYAAAAAGRAYSTVDGRTVIDGPGRGSIWKPRSQMSATVTSLPFR